MRRLTTITAGWLWLAVAYGLSTIIGVAAMAFFFLGGCRNVADDEVAALAGVCSGTGRAVLLSSAITSMLVLLATGTAFAVVTAVRCISGRHHEAPRAYALLVSATGAAFIVILVCITFAGSGSGVTVGNLLISTLSGVACLLVVGLISSGIASVVLRRRRIA